MHSFVDCREELLIGSNEEKKYENKNQFSIYEIFHLAYYIFFFALFLESVYEL